MPRCNFEKRKTYVRKQQTRQRKQIRSTKRETQNTSSKCPDATLEKKKEKIKCKVGDLTCQLTLNVVLHQLSSS
jgi:hypothetical protein